jgi:hypothetical protein
MTVDMKLNMMVSVWIRMEITITVAMVLIIVNDK